jgi:uncharacterized OsmC-like protein
MGQNESRSYVVQAKTSETFGRVHCRARHHEFLIDGPVHNGCPGEEVTPAEAFLAGVAACGVELVQVIGKEDQVPVEDIAVEITGTIDRSRPVRPDVTLFNSIRLDVLIGGVTLEKATDLVDRFKRRCPLFGTVSVATPDVQVNVRVKE